MQARLRRAVSTAYYALFHCLAASAAESVHRPGAQPGMASDLPCAGARQSQERVSAGADHAGVPGGSPRLCRAFVALQKARQEADYALDTPALQQSDVLGYMVSAEIAIRRFEPATLDARRGFVAHVLFRQRSS